MGREIDLLINYPKVKRNVKERGAKKTEEDRSIGSCIDFYIFFDI